MTDFVPWLRDLAEKGGKGVVNNIDARCLGRIADELERLRSIAVERMDLFRQAASKVEAADDLLVDIWFHLADTDDETLRGIADRARALLPGAVGQHQQPQETPDAP